MDDLAKELMLQGQLEELRRILTGYDRKELAQLNKLLKDKEAFAEEISGLLPDAFHLLVKDGTITLETLQPLVEDVLKESIRKSPHTLSDILFPIMMPAIRKAVAEDIKRMLDTVNKTLENSFSPKRISWRLQSVFSGRSYGEIVLSHAYIYQVKQVFLIHKDTGLLLAQAGIGESTDADLISAMLTAIKDFVQDSFRAEGGKLDSIEIGNLNIWIEQGPKALIAAVVEGNIPQNYRVLLKEKLEALHIDYAKELEHFSGDTIRFQQDTRLLDECIQKEKKAEKRRKPIAAILLILLILGGLGYWIYGLVNDRLHFNALVTEYKALPGIVVTHTGKHNGTFYVEGLKDPMTKVPKDLLSRHQLLPGQVRFNMQPFVSLAPAIVLRRAHQKLIPPKNMHLRYRNDTLFISGKAQRQWLQEAGKSATMLPGIHTIIFTDSTNAVSENILAIEKHTFIFPFNSFELTEKQKGEFRELIKEVKKMLHFNFDQDSVPVIEVLSHTSDNGNAPVNKLIARKRADQFIKLMIHQGLPPEVLVPKVVVTGPDNDSVPVRSVSFHVAYEKQKSHD